MACRLWYMNADFEMELAANSPHYKCPESFQNINRRLAEKLLWIAAPGDALLIDAPWSSQLEEFASGRNVKLVDSPDPAKFHEHQFTPWGWTPTSKAKGIATGAAVLNPDIDVVRMVNSKIWSFRLECEMGTAILGSCVVSTFDQIEDSVARACPGPQDKWVIKSPFGFAARDRVLGRGPIMAHAQAQWVKRRLGMNENLIFQPWLEVEREYGIVMELEKNGAFRILGVSDLKTNGAGTGIGYYLRRSIAPVRRRTLESVAETVAERLTNAGYFGPVGIDALEHSGGLLPLLEVNARYTMGFVALAVGLETSPTSLEFWSTK